MFFIVILVLLGLLFLLVEMLLLPGVSIGAILSAMCYGSAIYFSFRDFGVRTGIVVTVAIIILTLVMVVVALRARTWRRLSLENNIDSQGVKQPSERLREGDTAVTLSRLAPSGKIEFQGETFEARSVSAYIEEHKTVTVVGFENFTVMVKEQ